MSSPLSEAEKLTSVFFPSLDLMLNPSVPMCTFVEPRPGDSETATELSSLATATADLDALESPLGSEGDGSSDTDPEWHPDAQIANAESRTRDFFTQMVREAPVGLFQTLKQLGLLSLLSPLHLNCD